MPSYTWKYASRRPVELKDLRFGAPFSFGDITSRFVKMRVPVKNDYFTVLSLADGEQYQMNTETKVREIIFNEW